MNRAEIIRELGRKHEELARAIEAGRIQASIPVLLNLCELSFEELDKVYRAAIGCGEYCRIYCNSEGNGVTGENIVIKAAGRRAAKKIYPLMPIKQMPAFDPDAEIVSLTLTIPSWIDSINRKCCNISCDTNSRQAVDGLVVALTRLSEECSSIINKVRRLEDSNE